MFLTALGAEAARLRLEVLHYAEGPGDETGIGEGVFEVAGSRWRWLGLAVRPFVGPSLLVTRYERDVPFRLENRGRTASSGDPELHAVRDFRFRYGGQRFIDVLRPGLVPGTIQNLLGRAGRVEIRLRCEVTAEGHLVLRSDRVWFRFGRLRIRLRGPLGIRAEVENGFDEATERHTVRSVARNPILGTVLEYRGSFSYRLDSAER